MRRWLLVAVGVLMLLVLPRPAAADVAFSLALPGFGLSVGGPPVVYAPPPVVYAPPPVYLPPPVVYAPPPVVYARPPVAYGSGPYYARGHWPRGRARGRKHGWRH